MLQYWFDAAMMSRKQRYKPIRQGAIQKRKLLSKLMLLGEGGVQIKIQLMMTEIEYASTHCRSGRRCNRRRDCQVVNLRQLGWNIIGRGEGYNYTGAKGGATWMM